MTRSARRELDIANARHLARVRRLEQALLDLAAERDGALADLAKMAKANEATEASYKSARDERDLVTEEKRLIVRQRDTALGQFDELKARLFAAETENHRLRGYIDRVREDDSVRDGFAVETEVTDRKMPLRVPAADIHMPRRAAGGSGRDCQNEAQAAHWTSFGQRR